MRSVLEQLGERVADYNLIHAESTEDIVVRAAQFRQHRPCPLPMRA
jgi:hypothetical protein